ncbi:MAG: tRNA (adenosine(37)-N6)-threonylcarbamoyltransferase complex dimerization subunit type 1 TsaB [Armatimonadota bacterium]|jgi:tRNA threonylcarbamoyladenosine biosynthesis protein TsaB
MNMLGIETSGRIAGVALVRDGEVVGERTFEARMTLNQRLTPKIAELLGGSASEAGLDGIAVGIGPGSFTGVRVGVAVAKALAHGLALPLAGIAAPEAIVAGLDADPGTGVCVLQEARADEFYATTLIIEQDGLGRELESTSVLTLPRALRTAEALLERPPDLFAGDAVAGLASQIRAVFSAAAIAADQFSRPSAREIARIAGARPERLTADAVFGLTPRYVRVSQAERQFGLDLGLGGG